MRFVAALKLFLIHSPRLFIFILAAGSSLLFSVVAYQNITASTSYRIAEDGYDQLARGIYLQHSFSYHPNPHPTVLRGPVYPAFVALLLALNDHWYPLSIQLAQALLHGLTCLLTFGVGTMLFDSRRSLIAGILCAIHPYLIWYASRIVTETFSTFIFTAAIYLTVSLLGERKWFTPVLLGATLGIASLCKSSFLPLVFVTPIMLFAVLPNHNKFMLSSVVLCVALLSIVPWTIRNYALTRQFIPIHSLLGYNLRAGDVQAEFYERAPFSYFRLMSFKQLDISSRGDTISHPWMRNSETTIALDADTELLDKSVERYKHEPELVLRKLLFGPIMFWTLSSTPAASALASILQIPLLILFTLAVIRLVKLHGVVSIHAVPIFMLVTYFAVHIPIMAIARFSVVLIPTMLIYVAGTPIRQNEAANPLRTSNT